MTTKKLGLSSSHSVNASISLLQQPTDGGQTLSPWNPWDPVHATQGLMVHFPNTLPIAHGLSAFPKCISSSFPFVPCRDLAPGV